MATLGELSTLNGGYLNSEQRDALAALDQIFTSYGLGTLAPKIAEFLKEGYSADTIGLLLQDTTEYKQRFSANEARRKAGLPVLSPAEYLSTERAYRQIMQQAGLPPGFYDSPDDFRSFLEMDKSPAEIQDRVKSASDFINSADSQTLAYFKQWYTTGDMMAFALDPNRAAPLVGKAFNAAQIGGAGAAQGFDVNKEFADTLAGRGVDYNAASQGFSLVAGEKDTALKLAAIYGENLNTQDLLNEAFLNDAQAATTRSRLASKERAQFGGSSGTGTQSLTKSSGGQV